MLLQGTTTAIYQVLFQALRQHQAPVAPLGLTPCPSIAEARLEVVTVASKDSPASTTHKDT
jgi:hypothetical protein